MSLLACAEGVGSPGRAGHPSIEDDDEDAAVDALDPEIVVPSTTRVVTEREAAAIESLGDDGVIVVVADAFWTTVSEGDVLVFGVTEHTPHGWLRRVETILPLGGGLWVETAQASLPDAIAQAEIDAALPLVGGVDPTLVSALPGVAFASDPDVALRATFADVVLWDQDGDHTTTDDQIVVDGFVDLEMSLDVSLQIQWFQLRRFELVARADAEGHVSVQSSAVPVPPLSVRVATWKFAPITTFVGPVPVVFVPQIALWAGIDSGGSVSFEGSTAIEAALSLDTTITWEDGWSSHADVHRSWSFEPLELSAPHAVDVRVQVGPELGLFVYDVVGPTLALRPFLQVQTDLEASRWSLFGGVRVLAAVTVDVLGFWLKPYDTELYQWSTLLAEGTWGDSQSTCCTATDAPGCAGAPGVEACVCADDPYCCTTAWDDLCVHHVETLHCGTCS